METQKFIETVQWASQRGLKIHPHLQHKKVDGVYGIYATQHIPRFTLLLTYPIAGTLSEQKEFSYPQGCDALLKRMHAATIEYTKGEQSPWRGLLNSLDTESQLKANNAYYFNNQELQAIATMNPILARVIQERNATTRQKVDELLAIDPSLNRDKATTIALNFKTRSWDFGFLPIFDQFNTSEAWGSKVFSNNTSIFFMASRDYKAGEQIWISYGNRDIYDYAVDYDFFDARAVHSICFAKRGSQFAASPFEESVVRYASKRHKMLLAKTPQGLNYQLDDDSARFLEFAPSSKMIEYVKDIAFRSQKEFKTRQASLDSFSIKMNQIIDSLLSANRIAQVNPETIPEKLVRFYHLLHKERQMLINNKAWVRFNSGKCDEIPEEIMRAVFERQVNSQSNESF